ncbi:TetR/AcrR family transcriptional regulator [Streptomyces muensis]|uniref:TetR/AcrR family transcriptional regulator n=1 Tax=Streptomyces muensis TaxID=1077944 RepID=A0A9X1PT61_STRM4|nr:helix-turn-helix domain-containing protein [Streptomyces muensis]MCF1592561.1 TetR/AcrR family transcriptional regulator [Streptomyces muensis]
MTDTEALGLRERKKLETWRAIRAAALRLIEERGYETVSLDEIASGANVSRSTLFNYFASKEAIVFDPDPQEPHVWRSLMGERPADEPLWLSLQAVLVGYLSTFSNRLAVQKRLKAASPALAESVRGHGEHFVIELREWAASRTPEGQELRGALLVNVAQAVMTTAYAMWSPDDGFDRLLELARDCFERASNGLGPRHT